MIQCVLIVYLVIRDEQFRRAVSVPGWLTSMGRAIKGQE